MSLVPIDHSEIATIITTDERSYQYHQHRHHHYYHHDQDRQGKPTYQVYCRADHKYALTIRDNNVILAPSDPSNPRQHWYKEHKFGTQVKDAIGLPSFALVNKATGEAIQHGVAGAQPVKVVKYEANDDGVDHSILWSEACIKDDNGEYKAIRMVNNIGMNMDAYGATKERGGVRDGTAIGLWEWNGGDNQRWKIIPY
ncbi:ricin B-like lectin R40C1 [Ipomoea triloba]|uniref:ricin B-like lectin R40C1 n=1 Tax=Ipomoea triloba TaxID=35885 RepID=UPI00125E1BE5|nr:ricin B-like lectin R40C1 [Ipomoea triloba]